MARHPHVPVPNEASEIVDPKALYAFKTSVDPAVRGRPRVKKAWLERAADEHARYVDDVRKKGIAHPGTTRRKVFGRGKRRRTRRRST